MIRRLIILLLIVGCVFGDTIVYNNDFLMFKRTKTLNKVEYIGIEEFKGKPVVKILIQSSLLGNQYTFISCDKIIELKNYNGEPIDYDCININNPINSFPQKVDINKLKQAGNHLVQFRKDYYTGFMVSMLGNVATLYGASENKGDIILYGGVASLLGGILMLISFDSAGEAGEDLIDAGEKLETED